MYPSKVEMPLVVVVTVLTSIQYDLTLLLRTTTFMNILCFGINVFVDSTSARI